MSALFQHMQLITYFFRRGSMRQTKLSFGHLSVFQQT